MHPAWAHAVFGFEETGTCRMLVEAGQNFWQYASPPMLQPDVQSESHVQLPPGDWWLLTLPQ
jgi:hypothetical protein